MHSSMEIEFSKNVYSVPLDAPAEESANVREESGHVISFTKNFEHFPRLSD